MSIHPDPSEKDQKLQVSDLRELFYDLNDDQQKNNQNVKNGQNDQSVVDIENGKKYQKGKKYQNGKEYILQFNPLDINRLKLEIENISYRLKLRERRKLNNDRSYNNLKQQKVRLQEYLDKLNDQTQKQQIQIGNNTFVLEKTDELPKFIKKITQSYYSHSEQFHNDIQKFNPCQIFFVLCITACLVFPLLLLILIAYLSQRLLNFLSNQEIQDIFQCTKVDITVQRYTKTLVEQDQFFIDDGTKNLEDLLSKEQSTFYDNQEEVSKLERIKAFLLNPTIQNFRNIEEKQKCNFSKINIQGLLLANAVTLLIILTLIYQSVMITQLSNEEYVQKQKYIDIPYIVCFISILIYELCISLKIKRFLKDPITISTWLSFFKSIIERYSLYTTFKFSLSLIVYETLDSKDLGIASLFFCCYFDFSKIISWICHQLKLNFPIINKYAQFTGIMGLYGLNQTLNRYCFYEMRDHVSMNFSIKVVQFVIFIIFSLRQRESGNYETTEFVFLSFKIVTTINFIIGISKVYSHRENVFAHHQFLEYQQNNVYQLYLKQRQQYDLNEISKIIIEYFDNNQKIYQEDQKSFQINLLQYLVENKQY